MLEDNIRSAFCYYQSELIEYLQKYGKQKKENLKTLTTVYQRIWPADGKTWVYLEGLTECAKYHKLLLIFHAYKIMLRITNSDCLLGPTINSKWSNGQEWYMLYFMLEAKIYEKWL